MGTKKGVDVSASDIFALSARAEQAQLVIQKNHQDLDPIISINRSLRARGYPIDLMTIDCLVTHRRVTFMLNDATPELVGYRFGALDPDDQGDFSQTAYSEVTSDQLVTWIVQVFSKRHD